MIDDIRVMLAARQEARNNFDQNRRVGVDTGMQINHAIEVANLLRHNLVQGAREDGNEAAKWGMCCRCFCPSRIYSGIKSTRSCL